MLELWNPWSEAEGLRRALDRAFAGGGGGIPGVVTPPVQVQENELGWRLEMDVPGVTPDDLDIEQEGARVRIRGARRMDGDRVLRFERTLQLPATADHGRLEARLEHGVLRLVVPRAERYQPRKLSIAVGGEPATIEGDERRIEAPASQ
ncbi:MAG TPA: Hsp20/alpha crystallin family protein [Miltoncostaeaceae bacterium]|jgi:HSP20 family protein|nr:Hsp20/alpha crystallin family protein [Miltoncostaeaceae bacterium]